MTGRAGSAHAVCYHRRPLQRGHRGMKVLLTGATGQVGWELQRCVPAGIELDAAWRACLHLIIADGVALLNSTIFARELRDC